LENFFRCPACHAGKARAGDAAWECFSCGRAYRVVEGIPLLVSSWETHARRLQELGEARPDWYEEPHTSEETGPCRHHLRKRRLYVERVLRRYLAERGRPRTTTLLDLGCGDGHHSRYLPPFADWYCGSDYNLERLLRARQHYPDSAWFLADILEYPVQDDFFEIIFCNHVLEHIPDDRQALQTMYRVLQPRGLLVLGVPNEGASWWQLAYKLQPRTLRESDHVHFYTAEKIGDRVVSQGFQILEIEYLGWGLPHWSLDTRVRQFKMMDDMLERVGRHLFPRQASSMYILAVKP
jgi:SAM-dependent methyltransferase